MIGAVMYVISTAAYGTGICMRQKFPRVYRIRASDVCRCADDRKDSKHDNLFEVKKKEEKNHSAVIERGIMRTSSGRGGYRGADILHITYRLHNSPDELLETVKCISTKEKETNNLYIGNNFMFMQLYVCIIWFSWSAWLITQ